MFNISEHKGLPYRMLVFAEVLKQGSFTAAAGALGHTKSGVSAYVSQLEAMLGVRLLNRSTRRLNLTPAGVIFARHSQDLADSIALSVAKVQELAEEPQGRLALTAPSAFEAPIVIPLISKLCQQFPKVKPELLFTDERLDLLEHRLDLSITVGELSSSNYRALPLGVIRSILVASPKFLQQHRVERIDQLSSLPLIITPWQRGVRLSHRTLGDQVSYGPNAYVDVNTSSGALILALEGMGVALVPQLFLSSEFVKHKLVHLLPDWEGEPRTVYGVHAYQTQLPFVLRQFLEAFKEWLSNCR